MAGRECEEVVEGPDDGEFWGGGSVEVGHEAGGVVVAGDCDVGSVLREGAIGLQHLVDGVYLEELWLGGCGCGGGGVEFDLLEGPVRLHILGSEVGLGGVLEGDGDVGGMEGVEVGDVLPEVGEGDIGLGLDTWEGVGDLYPGLFDCFGNNQEGYYLCYSEAFFSLRFVGFALHTFFIYFISTKCL